MHIAKKRLVIILNAGALAIGAAILFATTTGPSNNSERVPITIMVPAAIVAALMGAYVYLQIWKKRRKQKVVSPRRMSRVTGAGLLACPAGGAGFIVAVSLLPHALSLTIDSALMVLSSLAVLVLVLTGFPRTNAHSDGPENP